MLLARSEVIAGWGTKPGRRLSNRCSSARWPGKPGLQALVDSVLLVETGGEGDGFRPNHKLSWSGVQAIYAYYVYVDSSGVLHEPEPSVFLFSSNASGFTEIGLKDAFPDVWVRDDLLSMGRQSARYSDMVGEFGER